ncbi:dihydrodipicolinate synthase family protein [Bacillus sp. FJAT-27225]|uniref:dihydrodipicolinate synthase family protein n=1 Tax=Bacillus sp. FJAT-27225 TaxID=1743144 RepID=UPI00080C35B9|nr:dihydrodipicolinate synthase family protein [Bacillus sp. FJAT-27225]OCA81474.1 dihydrodipicolinate synthase family protein [Bacillus sp. FJAT-27225]
MDFSYLRKNLETITAINITPFQKDSKEIDWVSLEKNIEFLIEKGLKVIVPSGNTGEFYALSIEEAKQVTKRVVEIVDKRAIVMAGIGYSVPQAVELGLAAQDAGADCVMIHQPVHPYVTTDGTVSYFKEIINALDIPSVIYFKDPHVSDRVLYELASLEKFIGVKYAINDLPRFTKTYREVSAIHDIAWICGTAEKWAPYFYHAGAKGFTSGLVNIFPEKSFELLQALREEDNETTWKVWEEVLLFEDLRAKNNNGNNVVVIKEALELIGFKAGPTREPVNSLCNEDKKELEGLLAKWGMLAPQL